MVMLDVYATSVKIRYRTFLISKATFISFGCWLVSIVFPFVLCYGTGGFWQKHDIVYEQPHIKYSGDFLLLAITNDNEHPISCSSFFYYNHYVKSLDTCSNVKVRESDENFDGKPDSLYVEINAKLRKNQHVLSLYLVLPLNYSLQSPCVFHRQSAIIYQQSINVNSVSTLSVYGDLGLIQSEALMCSKYGRALNKDNNIFDDESSTIEAITAKYAKSKIKTTLDNTLTMILPSKEDTFSININLNYPEHKILFKPQFWQTIKQAWIQYLAIYIITSWIMFQLKRYIYENNLVLLYQVKTNINK